MSTRRCSHRPHLFGISHPGCKTVLAKHVLNIHSPGNPGGAPRANPPGGGDRAEKAAGRTAQAEGRDNRLPPQRHCASKGPRGGSSLFQHVSFWLAFALYLTFRLTPGFYTLLPSNDLQCSRSPLHSAAGVWSGERFCHYQCH